MRRAGPVPDPEPATYLDHIVSWVRMPGVELRDRMRGKTLWGVGVLSGPGHDDAQPMVDMLASAADYLDMRFGGVLLGVGDRSGDVLADADATARAEGFFETIPQPAGQPA